MKFYDSELKVMDLLWKKGELSAKQIADALNQSIGWNKNTSYTVIKKLVDKGAVSRSDPGFLCTALITRADAQRRETRGLIDRMYGGRADRLVASLLEGRALDKAEIERLRQMVEELS